jgi:DNA-binding protein HU-beta
LNKRELVGKMALDARITRAQAERALEALLGRIQSTLAQGGRVSLSGFGTFGVAQRKARKVRNPRNGNSMDVAAKRVPRFAPGVELKSALRDLRD